MVELDSRTPAQKKDEKKDEFPNFTLCKAGS